MKNNIRARSLTAALSFMAVVWLPHPSQSRPLSGTEAGYWAAIAKCAAVKNDEARLTCVDDVFRKAGLVAETEDRPTAANSDKTQADVAGPRKAPANAAMPAVAASDAAKPAALSPHEPKATSDSVAEPQAADARSTERRKSFGLQLPKFPKSADGKSNNDQIHVTLAHVVQTGNGKLVLTTTDGAVWRQVEDVPVRLLPREGQTMTIAKTSMGGFMCIPSKWVSFRCYRSR
jgi:hypothetical protein